MSRHQRNASRWGGVVAAILITLGGEAVNEQNPTLKRLLRYGGLAGAVIAAAKVEPKRPEGKG